jgi:hypothetical protein
MREWYNGYLFHSRGKSKMYNPDMVLYFLSYFSQVGEYPDEMLDTNIASDYHKVRRIFHLNNENDNFKTIQQLTERGEVAVKIVPQFSFEVEFTQEHFKSLLFYMGMLSIKSESFGVTALQMPNYVIKGLYLEFMLQLLKQRTDFFTDESELREAIVAMARDGNVQPFCKEIEKVLQLLSNRDSRQMSEKHLKAIIVALLYNTKIYYVKSEYETEKHYADIALFERLPVKVNYQFAFELKYLPKKEAKKKKAVIEAATAQLQTYLLTDELKYRENLLSFVMMITGEKVEMIKVEM